MKKGILLLLLFCSVFAEAQSLKEALFKGKLKNDNNLVIRKGDDLSKVAADSTRKATPDTTAKVALLTGDSAAKQLVTPTDSAALAAAGPKDSVTTVGQTDSVSAAGVTAAAAGAVAVTVPAVTAPAPKSNNAVWKQFVDSVAKELNAEVQSSKKIKKGMYYVTVSYAIETDGRVDITDVLLQPENAYLQSLIRGRLEVDTPKLEPVLNSAGTPRKVTRKYNFTVTKE